MTDRSDVAGPRLADLVAALSLATDLGMGQPMQQALRTCLLSVEAGRELGLAEETLSDVYYLSLLRFVGCTSDAHEEAAKVGGEEIAFRAALAPVLMADTPEFLRQMIRHFAEGSPPLTRLRLFAAALAEGSGGAKKQLAVHCEVAQMLARRVGLRETVGECVAHVFERWDGKGLPGELAGEAIPIAARIVAAARDVDVLYRLGGWELVADVLRRRRARAYDPAVVDLFLERGERPIAAAGGDSPWEAVLACEPSPQTRISESRLDEVLSAFADFADLKSPFTRGHSPGVAKLADAAARDAGLPAADVADLRRAALVHDLGRTGIANGIWDKPAALSAEEWERVRLHPYLSERLLSHSPTLGRLAALAGSHHERLDGSGYHRGSRASALPAAARILAAADAFQAMTQPRPHRPAFAATAAATQLRHEVSEGKLDHDAVQAVLAAAGQAETRPRHAWPAGLTDREVEVLRLISRGASNRVVATELTISVKTVGRHVENIYNKIGVSSRPAAALYAMEHDLIQG
ncbi:MAG: HD domain-containing phosphohydrolase [Gaiellaceae bacterium]